MSDDVSDIAAYYDESVEGEHGRLQRHQLEHDLTWRYLDAHLPPRGAILEIGAATGRYTVELARRGYRVTAVDLSPEMIAAGRDHVAGAGLAAQVRAVLENGRRPEDRGRGGFRSYLCDPAEIVPLHEGAGFKTLAFAAVEPAISAEDDIYNRLEGQRRNLWLDLLQAISQEPSIIGASRHLLYVGRKA